MKTLTKSLKTLASAALIVLAVAASAAAGREFKPILTGTMASGDAVIELAPTIRDDGKLVVRFAANTHTVALSKYDLMTAAVLEFDGRTIKPSRADSLRGHHAFGKIEFDAGTGIETFVIKITGIPAIDERVYEWK